MTSCSHLEVRRLANVQDLAALRARWNALAGGVPFRGFDWLESWWRAYGSAPSHELFVLTVSDERGEVLALAPWYLDGTHPRRRTIRFLGSGEACSDYLTILCQHGYEEQVTLALARWLCEPRLDATPWARIELAGTDQADATIARLLRHLTEHGKLVRRRARASCWRVNLPRDWDSYLGQLSKSHRKQLRRLERNYFQSGRAQLRIAENEVELETGFALLIKLHQRRRESVGDFGCFASSRFAAFHRESAQRLLQSGNLRLAWLEIDGRPVAVEYQVLGEDIVYAYQSGIEPDALDQEPGRLITMATLRQAIDEGRTAFDFLRGDEPYKAHWRAQSRPTHDVCVMSNTPRERLRHNLWLVGGGFKSLLKNGFRHTRVAWE